MPNNIVMAALLVVIFVLLVLILVLAALLAHTVKANQKDKQELKAENKDLLNRVLAKTTSEYKELTHVADAKEPIKKKTLEDQLIEEGALMQGYPNPYPREL